MAKNKTSYAGKGKKPRKKDPLRAKKDAVDMAIVGIGVVVGLVLGMIFFNMSQTREGQKLLSYEVFTDETDGRIVKATVVCEDLYSALEQTDGMEMSDGVLVKADTYEADAEKGEYWCIMTNGEDVTGRLKDTPVKDGQKIRLILKTK